MRVVPARDRCGADIVNVEIRADNLQGLLPAPGAMAVLEKTRAEHTRAGLDNTPGYEKYLV